ncbi:uncharacterized protein LOC121377134 isoform X2 [Gigantopelta aegis]|uniref:uncharacterized protein LOC121377134 isoform X2 n=1 Tax=Gigantopelta aegis TaxID=1735272 RepID=UPI001B88B01C|nr:uncharacterized protein LOC121377134 isoform X2 [Gigantopelta aegis]
MLSEEDNITEVPPLPPRVDSVTRNVSSPPVVNADVGFKQYKQTHAMYAAAAAGAGVGRPPGPGRAGCPFKPRSIARTSPDRFYESHSGSAYISHLLTHGSVDDGFHRKNIVLSQRLPRWIWFLIARSLGIKLSSSRNDRPIFATILHFITVTTALAFGVSGFWFKVYDIKSEFSRTTVLIGCVSILIGFAWMLFGIYAHRLAGTLFSNKNFAEAVRMHSKTFMKVSIALILMVLSFLVVAINLFGSFNLMYDASCTNIQLSPVVCHMMYISRAVYAFFCVLWNLLVVFILLSVCRTHTIGIRRFMRELAVDAQMFEKYWMENLLSVDSTPQTEHSQPTSDDWYIWDDKVNDSEENDEVTSQNVFLESVSDRTDLQTPSDVLSSQRPAERVSPEKSHRAKDSSGDADQEDDEEKLKQSGEMAGDEEPGADDDKRQESWDGSLILTNDELLFSYWKIYSRLSITSRHLQRWLFSLIAFILIWCADYIIYWTSHGATLMGILEFIVPLVILLIISSAYAEVNAEGQRMLKFYSSVFAPWKRDCPFCSS